MKEWKTYKIRDIATVNLSQYSLKEGWNEVTYLDTGSITENHIEDIQTFILPCDDFPSRARRKVQHNDILFSTVRPNQKHFGILKNPNDNLLVSTGFSVITVNPLVADANFVYYYITQQEIINYLQSVAEQSVSAYPSLKSSDIEDIDIELPSLYEQRRLALILKSIDDKIENNNRINHNLEQQAQALYKSWFVDFEPFRNGKFVESELGMIPEGWDAKPLSSICHIEKKTINPQKHPTCLFTHYSIPAYDNSELPELQKGSDILSNKYIISDYTILFSKLNPRIKRIWNVYKSESNPICSTEFVVYKPMDIDTYPFLYSFITGDDFYNNIMSKVNGATGSHQRFHPEETLDILVPYHIDCYRLYSQLVLPIIQQIDENKRENHYFASLRDSLLPKLMSGELKINDLTC